MAGRSWTLVAIGFAVVAGCAVAAGLVLTREQESPMASSSAFSETVSERDLGTVAKARVFFGHQSVGANLLDGITAVYASSEHAAPEITESTAAHNAETGRVQHALIGTNGDPSSKIRQFDSIVRDGLGDAVNVAMMKLCYVDVDQTTDVDAVFEEYRTTLAALQRDYPSVTFLHTTVPLTTPDEGVKATVKRLLGREDSSAAGNAARERYNALVRAEYGPAGRLFDLAAIESTAPDGSTVTGEIDGAPFFALYPGYASDSGHLNAAGAERAAAHWLALVATVRR